MKLVFDAEQIRSLTDERLVQLVRDESNDEALAELIGRYTPMIQKQATAFCRFDLSKDDLAQEGFLALLSAVGCFRFDGGASFLTFSSVCVRNRLVSSVRLWSAQKNVSLTDWENEELVSDGQDDPAVVLSQKDEEERLFSHLREILTEMEYQVLTLRLTAHSYAEISAALHIPEKSVDNAMQRIRRKLTAGSGLSSFSDQ